ncbi:MAG: hypothetical protein PHR81_10315 [Bacteroidales bacterium]|nr:hypothetical protein [Bacteroidales bacterium]
MIEEFELIEKLIMDYDNEHFPIKRGNPIEIIKLKMDYMGFKQKDLISAVGSKGLVSDVLNKKRKLSKKMIRELSKVLNLSQDILNTEYEISKSKCKEIARENTEKKEGIFNFSKTLLSTIENFSNLILQRGTIMNVSPMINQ